MFVERVADFVLGLEWHKTTPNNNIIIEIAPMVGQVLICIVIFTP